MTSDSVGDSNGRKGVKTYAKGYNPRTILKAFNGPVQSINQGTIVAWAIKATMACESSMAPIFWLPYPNPPIGSDRFLACSCVDFVEGGAARKVGIKASNATL